jgi:hypothetical protein
MIKDSRILFNGISAVPNVRLYTKQLSRISIPTIRPTNGDILGVFQFLGDAVVVLVIFVLLNKEIVNV